MRRTFGALSAPYVPRVAAVVALAALVLVAALVSGGGHGPDPARAATSSCVWTKHTKRVVKHVKRHGERTKVVRFRHHWTCDEVANPETAPTATTTPAPAPSQPVTESTEPEPNALGVAAEDQGGFRYTLSRQSVRSGKLTVQLNNRGEDPHDMDMQRVNEKGEAEGAIVEMPITKPGTQSTDTIEVEPGTYRMWCTLGHHAAEGMEATIKVE